MKPITTTICTLLCLMIATSSFAQYTLSGYLLTETGEPFVGEEIHSNPITITDETGYFEITNLSEGWVDLNAISDRADWINGVTVCDLIAIKDHFSGIEEFGSIFKKEAADVNESSVDFDDDGITTFDMVIISQLILGINDEFGVVPNWMFINPETYDPVTWWPIFDNTVYLNSDKTVNLVAVKSGDVNNSATVDYPVVFIPNPDLLPFEKNMNTVPPQNGFAANFKSSSFTEMRGFQFTLSYDPEKMEFIEMESDVLVAFSGNETEEGVISVIWHNTELEPMTIPDGEVVFSAIFNILEETDLSESMEFTSDFAPIESVNININGCNSQLIDEETTSATSHDYLSNLKIFPNPVSDVLNISFELEQSTAVKVSLNNLLGQPLWCRHFNSDFINEQISTENIANGIYMLEIEGHGQKVTRKIMIASP